MVRISATVTERAKHIDPMIIAFSPSCCDLWDLRGNSAKLLKNFIIKFLNNQTLFKLKMRSLNTNVMHSQCGWSNDSRVEICLRI